VKAFEISKKTSVIFTKAGACLLQGIHEMKPKSDDDRSEPSPSDIYESRFLVLLGCCGNTQQRHDDMSELNRLCLLPDLHLVL
jgi:hypothetical protein